MSGLLVSTWREGERPTRGLPCKNGNFSACPTSARRSLIKGTTYLAILRYCRWSYAERIGPMMLEMGKVSFTNPLNAETSCHALAAAVESCPTESESVLFAYGLRNPGKRLRAAAETTTFLSKVRAAWENSLFRHSSSPTKTRVDSLVITSSIVS